MSCASLSSLIAAHGRSAEQGQVLTGSTVTLRATVQQVRPFSKKLLFLEVVDADDQPSARLQVCVNKKWMMKAVPADAAGKGAAGSSGDGTMSSEDDSNDNPLSLLAGLVRIGDSIEVTGHPGRTRSGQVTSTDLADPGFSVFATAVEITNLEGCPDRLVALCGDVCHGRIQPAFASRMLGVTPGLLNTMITAMRPQIAKRERANQASRDRARDRAREASRARDTADDNLLGQDSAGGAGEAPSSLVASAGGGATRADRLAGLASRRRDGLIVVVENPGNASNTGSIMRTCDAFGVTKLCLIAPEFDLSDDDGVLSGGDGDTLRLASSSAHHWVDVASFSDTKACAERLAAEFPGIVNICTAVHSAKSVSLTEADLRGRPSQDEGYSAVALWMGNEIRGLTDLAHDLCELHVFVPMLGMVESLNQAVCAAIVVWEASRQRHACGASKPLDSEQQKELLERLLKQDLDRKQRLR